MCKFQVQRAFTWGGVLENNINHILEPYLIICSFTSLHVTFERITHTYKIKKTKESDWYKKETKLVNSLFFNFLVLKISSNIFFDAAVCEDVFFEDIFSGLLSLREIKYQIDIVLGLLFLID